MGSTSGPRVRGSLVDDYDSKQALLKTGRTVYFYQLEDVEASGTEIRKKSSLWPKRARAGAPSG